MISASTNVAFDTDGYVLAEVNTGREVFNEAETQETT